MFTDLKEINQTEQKKVDGIVDRQRGDAAHDRLRRASNNRRMSGGDRCHELSGDIFHIVNIRSTATSRLLLQGTLTLCLGPCLRRTSNIPKL